MARPVSKVSEIGAVLFALMDDGQWRRLDDVLAALGPLIPPGQAYRQAEKLRLSRQRGEPRPRAVPRSDEFLIASGRRSLAREVLMRQRRLERRTVDGVEQVRLVPARPEGGRRTPSAE